MRGATQFTYTVCRLLVGILLSASLGSAALAQAPESSSDSCAFITRELLAQKIADPQFGEDSKDLFAFYATKWDGSLLDPVASTVNFTERVPVRGDEISRYLNQFAELSKPLFSADISPIELSRDELAELAIFRYGQYKSEPILSFAEAIKSFASLLVKKDLIASGVLDPSHYQNEAAILASRLDVRRNQLDTLTALVAAILKQDAIEFEIRVSTEKIGPLVWTTPRIVISPRGNSEMNRFAAALQSNRYGAVTVLIQPAQNLAQSLGSWAKKTRDLSFAIDDVISGNYFRGKVFAHEYVHLLIEDAASGEPSLQVWNFFAAAGSEGSLPLVGIHHSQGQNFSEIITFNSDLLRLLAEIDRSDRPLNRPQQSIYHLIKQALVRSEKAIVVSRRSQNLATDTFKALEVGGDHAVVSHTSGRNGFVFKVDSKISESPEVDYEVLISLPKGSLPDAPFDQSVETYGGPTLKKSLSKNLAHLAQVAEDYTMYFEKQTKILKKYLDASDSNSLADFDFRQIEKLIREGLDLESPVDLSKFAELSKYSGGGR